MSNNAIIAHIAHTCDHGEEAHSVEIYAERGNAMLGDVSPFYLSAMVTEDGETSGFGIPMDKQALAAFAWSILRELEGLSA